MLTERIYANNESNAYSASIISGMSKQSADNGSIAEFVKLHSCPCSVQEVYSLAISLQYYIGNLYLEMADGSQEPQKSQYMSLAMRQLENKKNLQKICNDYLNELMDCYYKTGGPIIDDRLSESQLKDVQAFFQRILTNLLLHYEILVDMSSNGSMSLSQMSAEIDSYTLFTYSTLGKLYSDAKIQRTFNELTKLIPAV